MNRALKIGGITLATALVLGSSIYHLQFKLIYPSGLPTRYLTQNPRPYKDPLQRQIPYQQITLTTADNQKLKGWLMLQPSPQQTTTILFFHANAGNRGFRLDFIEQFYKDIQTNIFIIDYRGYQKSTGSSSQQGILKDVDACMKFLSQREEIDYSKIVVFGRSLGGAVAISAAAKYQEIKGLILENTFLSIPKVVSDSIQMLWIFKWLITEVWDSEKRIQEVSCPILMVSGRSDELIPPEHMDVLHQKAVKARFVEFRRVEDGEHNDTWVKADQMYVEWVMNFLENL